ncbi:hypothetical protein HY492_02235 [Candidatus Woesearchaeota archaeon]|nr:hypothetical protein [Candidatus Woesearchaeota archaeon]
MNKQLRAFHNDVRKAVHGKVDTFLLAEGHNYHPHISLGNGRENKVKELRALVHASKKDKPITITARKMAMRLRKKSVHYVLKV